MSDGCGAELVEGVEAVEFACLQVEEGIAGVFQKIRLMFDEQDGLACRLEAVETFGDAFAEFWADSGHWFVEQEQAGIHRCAAGQREQLLLAVGNFGGSLVGDLSEEKFFQQDVGFALVGGIAFVVKTGGQQGAPDALAGVLWLGEQDVVAHAEFADEAQVLKRPRHAEAADAVRRVSGEAGLAEVQCAGMGLQEAGDDVEKRCFPRAVATQQAGDSSGVEREANRIQNLPAGKAEGEAFGGEHGGRMGGHSGWGRCGLGAQGK